MTLDSCAAIRPRDALTRAVCDVARLNEEARAPGWSAWYLTHARATSHLIAAPHLVVELIRPMGRERWQVGDTRTGERTACGSLAHARQMVEELAGL